jgi:hypothetical protein
LILIFIGAVFLLQNTGMLPANAWANLWRLWPLILVLFGLELLLGHRVQWVALAGVVAVIGALALLVVTQTGAREAATSPGQARTREITLNGASQAVVTVRFGGGQLNLGALGSDARPDLLSTVAYQGPGPCCGVNYNVVGTTGRLEYDLGGGGPRFFPWWSGDTSGSSRMDVNLSRSVPITSLTVQTGAADAHLDLSSLRITGLDVSVGASSSWIRLPEAGATNAHISAGAATINIEIPSGVAAQIHHRGGLSTLTLDQTRFQTVDQETYRSADYDSASNRVDLTLETGVSTIHVS